jgi:hypothetical protein
MREQVVAEPDSVTMENWAISFTLLSNRNLVRIDSIAAALHQKHGEVRRERFGVKLPHHQRDLTAMVAGMVRQMLHQVR